ncbi:hydroxypyruvate isomerase family protein [Paenibacillus aestuarii]|uniref:Hydroxypyruvate isomerase family protein n=1 Tax=Paenibacillus aestuarii TaxID=516965 RepID=A0ABW0K8U5_9BACL|nr:TIM barrel protein [Paenibacillus aestuarii]
MNRFAAHLEMNFGNERSFGERWQTAAANHFAGCEFVWRLHDVTEVLELQEKYKMRVACLGGTTGFASGGERPVLTRPEDREWLVEDVQKAIGYAQMTSSPYLVFVPGNLNPDWSLERHREEALQSFAAVVPYLEKAGVTAVLEPLNSKVDHPGIYCDTFSEAARLIEQIGSPNVKILYDIYHMQMMGEQLVDSIETHHSLIGHYHAARVPGRNEPLGGDESLQAALQAIEKTGYEGFIGLEYKPTGLAEESYRELRVQYPSFFHD